MPETSDVLKPEVVIPKDRSARNGVPAEIAPVGRPVPKKPETPNSPTLPSAQNSELSWIEPENLPEWDVLVDGSPQASVFLKSWWLKAACGQPRILGYRESGKLIAGIPLHYERHFGLRICRMPLLTQTMGAAIAPPLQGKRVAQESRETRILEMFAEKLSHEQVFIQAFHPSCQNWLPFYWRGFSQTTHYTYEISDLTDLGRIWDGMDSDRRTNIRKARRLGVSVKECGPETVYEAANESFRRQRRSCPWSLQYLKRLYEAARANDAGVCMAAVDSAGKVHAAEFFTWSRQRGYRLAGGHSTEHGASGAGPLLVWSLIEFAAERTAVFDFEGSMRRPIEASFRSFGARRVPYHRIVKMPRWMRIALCAAGRVNP